MKIKLALAALAAVTTIGTINLAQFNGYDDGLDEYLVIISASLDSVKTEFFEDNEYGIYSNYIWNEAIKVVNEDLSNLAEEIKRSEEAEREYQARKALEEESENE